MICLSRIWSYETGDAIQGLAFSDNGNLGTSPQNKCAYILDPDGKLLNKVCGEKKMAGASYSNGRFGFINVDGHVYITDENGNLIRKIHVGNDYKHSITMTPNGFVACGDRCAFFDFNGDKLWDVDVLWVENGPSYYQGYWYAADWNKLLIIKDGKVVKRIEYGEDSFNTAVCGKYLAVSTKYHLYFYDLSNPKNPREIWKVEGFNLASQVAFNPDCKYMAVADNDNQKLKIYDINGNLVLEKKYDTYVISVAWWKDRIAVGPWNGRIYVYRVGFPSMEFPILE